MVDTISLSLEDTNEIRKKLGLKPISTEVEQNDKSVGKEAGSAGSTDETSISSRFNSFPPGGHAVSSVENQHFIDSDKVNFLRKKLAKLNGKKHGSPLLNDGHNNGESENGDWLNKVGEKKSNKPVSQVQMSYEEDEEDLPLLKLSHKMTDITSGKDVILTLKESSIHDKETDNDVLENEKLSHEKEDARNLRLRQMNKDRRRKRMKLQVSSVDIEAEEIEDDGSVLLIGAEKNVSNEDINDEVIEEHRGKVKVVFNDDNQINSDSDGGDFKPTKIKKRKKKDSSSALKNKRVKLPSQVERVNLVDEDYDLEDVENEFEIPKDTVKKSTLKSTLKTPEQIALEIRKEKLEKQQRAMDIAHLKNISKGLVVDERFTFLESLKSNLVDSEIENLTEEAEEKVSEGQDLAATMHSEQVTNETDNPLSTEEQTKPDFYDGLASTLHFLQHRNVLPSKETATTLSSSNGNERAEAIALSKSVEVRKIRERIASEVSKSAVKYSKDELEKIRRYEEEEIMKKVNKIQSQKLQGYNPQVQLVYKDEKGNQLTTKEAYKKLSQKFHGTKSNKKKQAKFQSKVELRESQTERNHSFGFL